MILPRRFHEEPDQVADWPDGRTLRPSLLIRLWTWFTARFGR